MNTLEVVIVGGIVLVALIIVIRRLAASLSGDKGSCRSCGTSCACEIKSKLPPTNPS